MRAWRKSSQRLLQEHRTATSGFEERLQARWATPLDSLEHLWLRAHAEAGRHNCEQRPGAAKDQDYEFDALARLHARASRASSEALVLLRSGYADGAYTRWRTVHEVVVMRRAGFHGHRDCWLWVILDVDFAEKAWCV